jgi:spoIIIJ-associated protein
MNYAEAEGSSIDEAIERALQHLGVSRDKVDIEIISNSTRGLFGLGGRRAKVRATLRRPLAVAAPEAPAGAAVRDSAPASRRLHDVAARAQRAAPSPTPRPAAPPLADAALARRTPAPKRQSSAPRRTPAPAPVPLDGASIERGRAVLAEIVRLIGSEGTIEVAHDADAVRLVISGDPSGTLIGRRGQTLDALEYLLNRILAHEDESSGRLVVDLEGYRLRRQQALEAMALRVAERARRRGKPVTLNPMSPRDRRIVHLALQDDPTLTTRSAGSGFYRKVVIVPANARRRARSGGAGDAE